MELHFYARENHVLRHPGMKFSGQVHEFIARKTVVDATTRAISHPAVPEGEKMLDTSESGVRVLAKMRKYANTDDQPLWPANAETAKACGCPFVAVEFKDGEFAVKASAAKTSNAPTTTTTPTKET